MKTKITQKLFSTIILLGAATLFALPLQAGRGNGGGGGGTGECPQGFEPGTGSIHDRTRALDGSGSQYGNKGATKGDKQGSGNRQGTNKGKGQNKGQGQGSGNPDECPNYPQQ
jgi:hypothetical protein